MSPGREKREANARELYRIFLKNQEAAEVALDRILARHENPNDEDWEEKAYAEWEESRGYHKYMGLGERSFDFQRCIACAFWRSEDGKTGECFGPEIACGKTSWKDCCEQWTLAGEEKAGEQLPLPMGLPPVKAIVKGAEKIPF